MSSLIIRLVCGLLFCAMVLGMVSHPPANLTQGLGALLPAVMLLGVALRGPRRSRLSKGRAPSAPPSSTEPPQAR